MLTNNDNVISITSTQRVQREIQVSPSPGLIPRASDSYVLWSFRCGPERCVSHDCGHCASAGPCVEAACSEKSTSTFLQRISDLCCLSRVGSCQHYNNRIQVSDLLCCLSGKVARNMSACWNFFIACVLKWAIHQKSTL